MDQRLNDLCGYIDTRESTPTQVDFSRRWFIYHFAPPMAESFLQLACHRSLFWAPPLHEQTVSQKLYVASTSLIIYKGEFARFNHLQVSRGPEFLATSRLHESQKGQLGRMFLNQWRIFNDTSKTVSAIFTQIFNIFIQEYTTKKLEGTFLSYV